jgi:HEPN domain-containing protein
MDLEIESLLFKQVEEPKHYWMTKIINVFDNRYRINVYIEFFDEIDRLMKRKIHSSYFCHYNKGSLKIIPDKDKKDESEKSLKSIA